MLFLTSIIYDRIKIPNSKELFFCEAVFATVGFFVYIVSDSILRAID